MDQRIESSAQLFGVGNYLFRKSVEDLDDEEARKRVTGEGNPIIWILGHITVSRCGLLRMLGKEVEHPWGDRFSRGSDAKDPREFPSVQEIASKWNEVAELLAARLGELTDDELSAQAPRDFPVPDKSVRGAISFMAYHEAYHAGQLGYIRKCLGKTTLVG